ncbi:cohesin domain-containing protein [Paenibacillus sp. FSL P2-0089]|uniref:cohesin domain-containing protein n=1 Tax=unclassified Paenibacillus TaxID=185978 RepID=UPI0030D8649A
MKKIIMFLTIFMCFVATTAFASPSITGLQFDGTVYSGTTTVRNYDTNELIASEPINASSIKLQGAGGSYTGSDGSPNVVNVSIITDSGTYPIGTVGYNNVISVGSYQNINKIILTGTNRASSVNVFITITPAETSTPTPTPTATPTPTPTVAPEPTSNPTPTPALKPTLDVNIAPEKIGLGKEFTADISLKNVKDIYAEDFEVKYDKEHLEYLGFEEINGYKVYNKPIDQNGAVRFVVASQGEEYGINKDTVVVKLKFKAKSKGTAIIDATKARIADTEEEYDLERDNCLEDSVIIEATDVNKSGTYTLVDLAIDARYFKYFAPDVDPVKYNAQQAGDEYVNDDDLLFIVDQLLNNPDYLPNT